MLHVSTILSHHLIEYIIQYSCKTASEDFPRFSHVLYRNSFLSMVYPNASTNTTRIDIYRSLKVNTGEQQYEGKKFASSFCFCFCFCFGMKMVSLDSNGIWVYFVATANTLRYVGVNSLPANGSIIPLVCTAHIHKFQHTKTTIGMILYLLEKISWLHTCRRFRHDLYTWLQR